MILRRFSSLALVGAMAAGAVSFVTTAAPAAAAWNCSSNSSIWYVHRRLDGAINQLSRDQRDYGGHRVSAINDLQAARTELIAAEQYAVNVDHQRACASGPGGYPNPGGGMRGQGGSNYNIHGVRIWVENLIDQLQQDNHDYDGHRVAAINDMQNARNEMVAAEQYARSHGY